MCRLWALDPSTYVRHPLHRGDRIWPESNCYVDLWIELLHASVVEPLAALSFALAIDVEGDQWTFFKFPHEDLYQLYGIEVIELNVWRPLAAHVLEQLSIGRPSIVEVDAYYLPDTAGTSYRVEHVKTSIAIQALDQGGRWLGYFHNAGYYELDGLDFEGIFHAEGTHLPPYVEVAKLHMRPALAGRALVTESVELLRKHLARRPHDNPFRRYAARVAADLDVLASGAPGNFHRYAFATLRQCGAAFELGGEYLRWLHAFGERDLDAIASSCDVIAETAKAFQFRTARLVTANRPFDPAPMLETMASAWDETMTVLGARYGECLHQHEKASHERRERATASEPGEGSGACGPRERASRGVRGAKPLG
jgi:hypothetical protein